MLAFAQFVDETGIEVRELCTYGRESIVFVVIGLGTYDPEKWVT
jgi:hypothetical protein